MTIILPLLRGLPLLDLWHLKGDAVISGCLTAGPADLDLYSLAPDHTWAMTAAGPVRLGETLSDAKRVAHYRVREAMGARA